MYNEISMLCAACVVFYNSFSFSFLIFSQPLEFEDYDPKTQEEGRKKDFILFLFPGDPVRAQ
jgi:hypothetical protein